MSSSSEDGVDVGKQQFQGNNIRVESRINMSTVEQIKNIYVPRVKFRASYGLKSI